MLSISNIAWSEDKDELVYKLMKKYGFVGLEIAPTRVVGANPYDKLDEVKEWNQKIKMNYGFDISSMQSIWYGRKENLFGTDEEYMELVNYTKKLIEFAQVISCKNIVFGCPKNRVIKKDMDKKKGIEFFELISDYAYKHNTVIALEANPIIYKTNYINYTSQAIELIKIVNSDSFKLNLDVGTIIENKESLNTIIGNVNLINHIHISEPMLKPIKEIKIHKELKKILKEEKYTGYCSIEMGLVDNVSDLEKYMKYVSDVFGDN